MKSCTSGINQAKGRISGLKDKVEELWQTSNEYRKKIKAQKMNVHEI